MGQVRQPRRVQAYDGELGAAVARAQDGDETAFAFAYRMVQPGLLGYLRGLVGDDAEDVASDAWLEIARDLGRFKGDGAGFRGWIKHVAAVERTWVQFILDGPSAMPDFTTMTETDWARRADEFRMLPGETLAGALANYAEVARRTDELVVTLPDLDATQPLPKAPRSESGAQWSARRVLMHIIAETAQHAGHADIIRESLDGAKTMG
ncbi:DUF664 domain-containing protein [Streptomyces mirabilis]|uniref:mycothiol transferase n=1 Tax=Streptomyces mirabilis TaxID=68239 RepID=UPI0036EF4DF8